MIVRSDRRDALLLALAYLALGFVAWWTSPTLDPTSGETRDAGSSMLGLWVTAALLVGFAILPWRHAVVMWLAPAIVGP
ncbi:MAG TPA: hypothetical protein VF119_03585, partial [Candidatus Limnocylindrales bacterium]